MKVLVTFALENEFAPWRAMRNFRAGSWGTAEAFFAQVGAVEAGVVLTGVGPRQAVLRISHLLGAGGDGIAACVSSGLAGALRPDYTIGQVLAARAVQSDAPRPDQQSQTRESSGALVSFAAECGATVVERFYSASRVVSKADEKRHLGSTADAVEMESFEVLRLAAESGIPAIAVRAVSDLSTEDLPFEAMQEIFTDDGKLSMSRVAAQLALHPEALPNLMKLGQQSKRAAGALAEFLDKFIVAVSDRAAALDSKASAAIQ